MSIKWNDLNHKASPEGRAQLKREAQTELARMEEKRMAHEVYTAVEGGLVQAQLPLYSGERQVRAAQIVAVGLSPTATVTRLALLGGAHVDVSKAWMQKYGATSGQYYVQDAAGETAETMAADAFESQFTLESDAPLSASEVKDQQSGEGFTAQKGHFVEDFAALDEHPGFIEWFKEHANASLLGQKLAALFEDLHGDWLGTSAQPSVGNGILGEAAKPIEAAGGTYATGTVSGPGPSAADLDKVVEEQKAANDTANFSSSVPETVVEGHPKEPVLNEQAEATGTE